MQPESPGGPVEVEIFGEWTAGEVAGEPLFDPLAERKRGLIKFNAAARALPSAYHPNPAIGRV